MKSMVGEGRLTTKIGMLMGMWAAVLILVIEAVDGLRMIESMGVGAGASYPVSFSLVAYLILVGIVGFMQAVLLDEL